MAINQAIWRIQDKRSCAVKEVNLEKEDILECIIEDDPSILSDDWIIIGRQVATDHRKEIDFLGLDRNGKLIIIELKRDKTPRDVVAQVLDYATWVRDLKSDDISKIFRKYSEKYNRPDKTLEEVFRDKFNNLLDEDQLNQGHKMIIVCSKLDPATERIVKYLSSDIPINVIFFKVFEDEGREYISRVWFIEPRETEENSIKPSEKVPWNKEYYVSFGEGVSRNWEDARKLGFVSAGGGKWYTSTLKNLEIGSRIWVNIPGSGYVGVGEVIGQPDTADKVLLEVDGRQACLKDISTEVTYFHPELDQDLQEYIVPVKWIRTVSQSEAVKEFGFFGNQNSVCQPKTEKWDFTVNFLSEKWEIDIE